MLDYAASQLFSAAFVAVHCTSPPWPVAGEIVVFNIDGRDIPIVHRVIKVHERADEEHLDILTKVSTGSKCGTPTTNLYLPAAFCCPSAALENQQQ
jgi:hypothetical protein